MDGVIVVCRERMAAVACPIGERHRVVPERVAATSVAAVLSGQAGDGWVVRVLSGGNLDAHHRAGGAA